MEYIAFWIFCSLCPIGITVTCCLRLKYKYEWKTKFPKEYLDNRREKREFKLKYKKIKTKRN